ncbi:hypothetical protein [Methylobacterium longum]|uniref:Phosphatase PAP2 family protein n=1 Tax=Methylobacterium longum TaxID=767694 RepID=A0ABT8AVE4_9HYPH|nr:hypothetical protein [Methylobacterium longum]MDN3573937.1 hypothetical protein [Methylobacterium longum]GJE13579.1 hypothetical protein FOHLNKBM_4643 [Methylobacterium longum]
MAGSNEGNEGNEGNSGSLGRGGGGGFSVLPDRVDLPFVSVGSIDGKRLTRAGWRQRYWAGEWAAWLTLVDFSKTAVLPYARPNPAVTITQARQPNNIGNGTCVAASPAVQASWQTGIYQLRCINAANNGIFTLTDPLGRLMRLVTPASSAVSAEIVFTLTAGGTPFAVDDGFDIAVGVSNNNIWLNPPVAFRARAPVELAISSSFPATANKGTCNLVRPEPTLRGVQKGDYKLACTNVDSSTQVATFSLTAPSGTVLDNAITASAAQGSSALVRNQVQVTIVTGSTQFSVGDTFTITVFDVVVDIAPKLAGNQGNGTCTLDPVAPSPDGAIIGLYTLRCTKAATVGAGTFTTGAEFSLVDPDGVAVGTTIVLSAGAASSSALVNAPLKFTVTDGDPTKPGTLFAVGDGFDLDLGGFEEIELRDLVRAAEDERADALGEIIAQHDGFISYFMAALSISPKTHPATCLLLQIGSVVGAFVSLHFKGIYQRRRPSQRAPALLPPVPVPGHPAYPSGHATQAHLMALCVRRALPANGIRQQLGPVLNALANRIARNREIAGLHFGSDSRAGAQLAQQIVDILDSNGMPQSLPQSIPPDTAVGTRRRFKDIVATATAEWQ